jgi:hypothetical protein
MNQPEFCPTCKSGGRAYPNVVESLAGSRLCTDPWHPRVEIRRTPVPAPRIPAGDETITRDQLEIALRDMPGIEISPTGFTEYPDLTADALFRWVHPDPPAVTALPRQPRPLPDRVKKACDVLMACTDAQLDEALLVLAYEKPEAYRTLRELVLGGDRGR